MRSRITSYKQLMHILSTRFREGKFYEGEINFDSLFGKYFVFRGQSYSKWRLIPRASRGQELTYDDLDLTDNTRTGIFAQMYSKSARVIDFTTDLKIALYYACKDEQYKDVDGSLIVHLANPWDLNVIGASIAKYIAQKDFPHRYQVTDMAYEISLMDEVQYSLQLDGFPSESTIEYICLLIHQFLRYGTMIFFDKSIYEKYPKIKRVANDFSLISSKVKLDDLYRLTELIKSLDSRITNINVGYSEEKETTRLLNSKGLDLKKSYSYGIITCDVVMKDEDDVRDEFGYQLKLDYNDFNIEELAKTVVSRLQRKLHPVQIESKSYPVILENKMVISLLSAFTSMFSSESALRNMTLLKGKEGEKIASNLITLVDDPLYENGIFQHSFDNQGVACYKKNLIDKGVFQTLLYDLKTAKMFGVTPTGNSFGGINPTNLCLECGTTSLEDMAKTINDGLLITSLQGLHAGLNPVSGDFSAQASGFRIENGKITYPVSLIVVSGNFLKLLQDVVIVGNDEFVSYNGVSAPSIKVSKLSISGK